MPDVEAGIALDDPVGHDPPHAAGAGDTVGAEAAGDEEAPDLGRLAEDELAVRGEGLGAVDQAHDLRAADRRHAAHRALHQRREALPVGRQEPVVEVARDPVEPPRRGLALVAAGDQTADLLAEVDQVVRVPQHRDRGVDPVDGLRDEILVRHRDEGDRHAHHPPDLRRVDPARVHDDVGADGPLGGLDLVDAAVPHADAEDPGARADLGPALPGAVGQRHREAARVEVPVGREIHGPEHAVGRHHREEPPRLVRSHLLEREPERLGPPLLAPVLQEAVGRAREPEAARLLPAGVAAGLGGEPPVALDAPHHEARERDGRTELADQPRGVEGRAAGELGTLHQHDVAPALGRQVVRDARAAHAAPDDHCSSVLGHGARL